MTLCDLEITLRIFVKFLERIYNTVITNYLIVFFCAMKNYAAEYRIENDWHYITVNDHSESEANDISYLYVNKGSRILELCRQNCPLL